MNVDVLYQVEDAVGDDGLNLLINNAGLLPQNRDLQSVTPQAMRDAYEVWNLRYYAICFILEDYRY